MTEHIWTVILVEEFKCIRGHADETNYPAALRASCGSLRDETTLRAYSRIKLCFIRFVKFKKNSRVDPVDLHTHELKGLKCLPPKSNTTDWSARICNMFLWAVKKQEFPPKRVCKANRVSSKKSILRAERLLKMKTHLSGCKFHAAISSFQILSNHSSSGEFWKTFWPESWFTWFCWENSWTDEKELHRCVSLFFFFFKERLTTCTRSAVMHFHNDFLWVFSDILLSSVFNPLSSAGHFLCSLSPASPGSWSWL